MYGKIIDVIKKLWNKVANFNKNMYILMKFNKYTPKIYNGLLK